MVSNHRGACAAGDGFGAIEVVLVKRQQPPGAERIAVVLTVAYDPDVWQLVNEGMDEIAANVMRVRKMNSERKMHVEESAQLFQRSLEPFFTLISATSKEHVMDKLSVSLRKALLLMAMERYDCNREKMCRALGLTKAKLEKELKLCGLVNQDLRAA
ncbi:hypothetical protein [Geomonas subterranea]|uniref:Uncharacterized protein n=1 Tax=Geomonas subterranea TaxID=2847989 RepID=A0ABX8LFY7_9BACT|nr:MULTISPECIES: hypothetical protein [Geomonas]QXE90628.1 hypothetical protein KP001_19870 [Geomonas subterranea]QXM11292.1 hypothetical protein KP002_09415 [Geomonas subterranea]